MQWASVEKSSKDDIQERKIRVVFLPSDGSAAAAATPIHNNVNGSVSHLNYILPSITNTTSNIIQMKPPRLMPRPTRLSYLIPLQRP